MTQKLADFEPLNGRATMNRIAVCAALLLAACATRPENIAAVANAGPCTQADKERLAILYNKQREAANADALGVFVIGVPIASLAGSDNQAEIAILKGRCGDPGKKA